MILFGKKSGKLIIHPLIILFILIGILYFYLSAIKTDKTSSADAEPYINNEQGIEIIADNLNIPWEMVFLPDGDMLITERPGNVIQIGKKSRKFSIDGVEAIGEGGLLGISLHPNYKQNNWVYLYLSVKSGGKFVNRVERYRFDNNNFLDEKVIIDNIPAGKYHNGGRILFGPDNFLYITTGDAGNPKSAQDKNSLAGKILRIKDNGGIPDDNPFNNAVWSYGHRNSQGLAWDDRGRLWATEHGRSGILSGLDELNQIEKGKNYGWPLIQGSKSREDMQTPVINSGPDETWAPAGMVYLKKILFFTGLRGQSVYKAKISEGKTIGLLTSHLRGKFGRLRAIKIGPDGFLYISTSNTDGRGKPAINDDKIIKINPEFLTGWEEKIYKN